MEFNIVRSFYCPKAYRPKARMQISIIMIFTGSNKLNVYNNNVRQLPIITVRKFLNLFACDMDIFNIINYNIMEYIFQMIQFPSSQLVYKVIEYNI